MMMRIVVQAVRNPFEIIEFAQSGRRRRRKGPITPWKVYKRRTLD
jgi:hypothetical protein